MTSPRSDDDQSLVSSRKRRKSERPIEWRLYSGNNTFQEGDSVFVRPKSARETGIHGRLLARFDDRKWKLWNDGKEILVNENRLIPVFSSSNHPLLIVITSETIHYRQLAASQLLPGQDSVLEIGCSTGETSEVVWKRASSWVGFDTSSHMVERTLAKYSAIQNTSSCRILCQKMDALLEPEQAFRVVHQQHQSSVVLMDIGGNREINGVARMMKWILTSDFPQARLIVVKSEELFRELSKDQVNTEGMLVLDGIEFLERNLLESRRMPSHPLQAPKAYSPTDPSLPICRYHNYHKKGCCQGSSCPFDHVHCHMCLGPGHIAKECTQWK